MTTGLMMMAAPGTANAAGEKVNICHRTGNDGHPYTFQRVAKSSTAYQGHLDHRTENSGGEDKYWNADGVWNGISHEADDFKPDYIEGLDAVVPTGAQAGRDFCRALTVSDVLVAGTPYQADPPTCFADGVLKPQTQLAGVTASQDPAGTGPGTYTITFEPDETYVLTGSPTQTITVLPQLTGAQCDSDLIEVAPAITMADPCGTAKDKVNGVDKTGYSFDVNGNKVKFTADEGYVLTGPSVLTAEFTNVACAEVAGTETATPKPSKTPDKEPTIKGTEAVPTAVDAGIGGNGPTMTGTSPIDLLAQMLVGGGLALLIAAGWLRIGRQTHGVHQV